ncbi:MAG: hypothetical protein R3191_02115 [Anaerolineales bacterium]|nr:hypothetical protein [Anaerolineales bacterium]
MIQEHPERMIILGFVLVLVGFLIPFAMMLKFLESSFLLGFLSFGSSISGMFMGLAGASLYRMKNPPKDQFRPWDR